MKNKYFFILTLIIFIFFHLTILADHLKGGEITYTWQGGNDYEIQLTLYRDCFGLTAPTRPVLLTSSMSCSISAIIDTLFPTSSSPTHIIPICPGTFTSCTGGTFYDVEKWVYTKVVTLPANCVDWQFIYSDCCRSGNISTLPGSLGTGAQYSAFLNNFDVPFNSSAKFVNDLVLILSIGVTQTILNGASDLDGDSLSVELVRPLDDSGAVIPYVPGYSHLEPLSSSTPISLKTQTGDLGITPTQLEVATVVFEISEYRNGILVGRTRRDVEIRTINSSNQSPRVTGINGTNQYIAHACIGDTLKFMVYSSDPDSGETTNLTWSSFGVTNANLTTFGAANDSGLVEFIADSNMVSSSPYMFNITALDSHCPYNGFQSYIFQIYVNGCTSEVWPGDANADLKCDMYDMFSIGLGYNSTGPVRPGATTNWVAETSTDWPQNFNSGVNYKNADCNGDGIIDHADTNVIVLNYGLTHPLRLVNPNYTASNNFVKLTTSQGSAGPSDTFKVMVQLGSSQNPVSDIYGIAFNLEFNPFLIDSTRYSFSFLSSPLGTPGADLLTFTKIDWSSGQVSAVAVRNDQVNSISDTNIAQFEVSIIDTISSPTYSLFSLRNMRGISSNSFIQSYNPVTDSIEIKLHPVGLQSKIADFSILLYPNPANKELMILTDPSLTGTIQIYNIMGKKVLESDQSKIKRSIDISNISNGVFYVKIKTDKGIVHKQLYISH